MKSFPLDKLGDCPTHGKHAGKTCPLCDRVGALPPLPDPVPETPKVDRSTWYPGPEREMHDLFCNALHRYGVKFVHARTDQKSTIAKGWPDFTCMREVEGLALVCLVELKNRHGRTSKGQDACIADLTAAGIPVLVTGDFRAACEFVRLHLKIPSQIESPNP